MHKKSFLPLGLLLMATIISGKLLITSVSYAEVEQADATVTVSSACTMFRESTTPHVASANISSYTENIGTTRLKTICNDKDGYAIYAIGYSNNEDGNTNMYGEEFGEIIPTGTINGNVSNWSMKLTKDLESYNPQNLTITTGFENYHEVPAVQTKVVSYEGATDTTEGSVVTTTYAARVSSSQIADTYTGQVKYTMVHPGDGIAPDGPRIYIQDITPANCPKERTLVYDKRDEEPYYIQEITANGETLCWMTSNLNIAGGTKLTSELTNMRPGEEYILPESNNVGFSDYTVPQLYNSGNDDCSTTPCASYYNYIVATFNKSVPADDTAEYDICPKGWRLPVHTEFNNLVADYGNSLTSAPWYSSSAGMYTGGNPNVNAGGSTGFYWAGDTNMSSGSYPYALFASSTASGGSMSSFSGFSIRCVAKAPVPEGKIYIQDVTLATCPSERTLVYDKRDEKPYYIQKITADNTSLCWMTTNLDIAGGTKLTSTLTNLQPGSTHTLPASSPNGFDTDFPDEYVYNSGNTDCIDNSHPCYSYYSHQAAAPDIYINSGDVQYDICPAGWRLPKRDEYVGLMNTYDTSEALISSPWYGVYSGQNYEGSFLNVGGLGRYWTSEIRNSGQGAYTFLFMTSSSMTMSGLSRGRGAAIRCVSKDAEDSRIYIQDITKATCPTESTVVYDKRDMQTYTIQMYEGNCWMTTNMNLAGGTPLYTETSNVPDGYTETAGTPYFTLPQSSLSGFDNETPGTALPYVYNSESTNCGNDSPCYSYYSYPAATAGSNPNTGSSTYDICPKGWRLPNRDDVDDEMIWPNKVDTDLVSGAWHGVYSGQISQGVHNQSSYAYYWLSANTGDYTAYVLFYGNSYASTMSSYTKFLGAAVRCVAKDGEPEKMYLQDITLTGCPTTPTTVYDRRDNEEYTIQKLADGNCWMLDNLRLEGGVLTTASTNLSHDVPFGAMTSKSSNFNSYTEPYKNADSKNVELSYGDGTGKVGVYYNYCAATAGTICDELDTTSDGVDANYDICPKGWRMPTGGSNGEFAALYAAYDSNNTTFKNALHLVPSGYYLDSSAGDQGTSGAIWSSSTTGTNDGRWGLYYGGSFVVNTWGSYRNVGRSVRCIAKNGTETVIPHDIQDVTLSNCPTTPTTVYDTRDGNGYVIQKLKDGNCWMLDNLNLGRSTVKVLTPDDTNVTEDFILPGGISTGFSSYVLPQINIDSRNDTASYGEGYENEIGVYYNYCAATAGTYCDASGEATGDAYEDICPKGWRLPTGGETGEYQTLISSYDDADSLKIALRAPLSGYFKYSSTGHIGRTGSAWTSTGNNNDHIYSLDVRTNRVQQDYSSDRNAGISIRCIVKNGTEPTPPLPTLQGMTLNKCPTDSSMIARDSRDDEEYRIQKLADGKCWLLDNLKLRSTGSNTITATSADTNIAQNASFIVPTSSASGITGSNSSENAMLNADYIDTDSLLMDSTKVKTGVFYNYCAASAGTICSTAYEGDAQYDICPKNWHMPSGGSSGEYGNLRSNYNSNAELIEALQFAMTGSSFRGDTRWNPDTNGGMWTSTAYIADRMYTVTRNEGTINMTERYTTRDYAFPIRCVMD